MPLGCFPMWRMWVVGVGGGADLGADRLVGAEQGHVAVGRSAGNDVDKADVVEVAKGLDDVAVEALEVVERCREEALPEASCLGEMSVAGLEEVGLVFAGGHDLARDVFWKLGLEGGMGELFEENRREIQVAVEADVVPLEFGEHAQQRKIGLCRRFVQPFDSVRPGAVIDDVGQMRVKGKGEK